MTLVPDRVIIRCRLCLAGLIVMVIVLFRSYFVMASIRRSMLVPVLHLACIRRLQHPTAAVLALRLSR